jgi:hypothetical protein
VDVRVQSPWPKARSASRWRCHLGHGPQGEQRQRAFPYNTASMARRVARGYRAL